MMREIHIIKFVPVDNTVVFGIKKKVKSMRLINGLFQVCGVYILQMMYFTLV